MKRLRVSKHVRCFLGVVAVSLITPLFTGCLHSASQNTAGRGQGRGLLFATFDVSPDGKTILFAGAGNGGSDLFLLNLATRKITQLTNTPDYEAYPAFSPDGKRIVYQCAKAEGTDQSRHLFLRSLDGKQVRQLTKTPATDDESPRFSPNGEKVVFSRVSQYYVVSPQQSTGSGFDVFAVNRNGTGLTQVTHLNCDGVMRPRFYPDSRHILFEETTIGAANVDMHLARADVTGQQTVQTIVNFSGSDAAPCFSSDGTQLVFSGNFNGTMDLYQVPISGGKPSKIIANRTNTGYWSPAIPFGGKSIYFLERYNPNLFVVNANGTGLRQIADSSLFSDPLHWKP